MALEEFRLRFGKGLNELLGTGMLLMIIQLSVAGGLTSAPLVIGLGLVALVYAGAPISGAHYNPAVSLSIFLRGKMSLNDMLMYWVFQIAGGFAGALLGGVMIGKFAVFQIGEGYHLFQAFLAEFVFTGLLCFVVLAVATNSKVEGNMYYSRKFLPFRKAGNDAEHGSTDNVYIYPLLLICLCFVHRSGDWFCGLRRSKHGGLR